MINSPLEIYVGYFIDYYDELAVVDWAANYFEGSSLHSQVDTFIELMCINIKQQRELERAVNLLAAFVRDHWPDFKIAGPEAEAIANAYFRERLEQYLVHECSPWDVCKLINPIEQIYDFPAWLGNMYNQCDWIEPHTNPN